MLVQGTAHQSKVNPKPQMNLGNVDNYNAVIKKIEILFDVVVTLVADNYLKTCTKLILYYTSQTCYLEITSVSPSF